MNHFVHPQGLCETTQVGARTRIWAFAHVLPGAHIGESCNICDHVFVENDVIIGDRVTVKCGVAIWDGSRIEDDAFIGPNVTFTNDTFPRSREYPAAFAQTVVRRGASLGANCTILPGLTIGMKAMVGAGSVLTRDVPPYAIVVGNPARIVGYVDARSAGQRGATKAAPPDPDDSQPRSLRVSGVSLHRLNRADDLRGSLVSGEVSSHIPFEPRRFFSVMRVPSKDVRGAHAHHQCEQFLVCQAGSVAVVVDDGHAREEVILDDPGLGLYLPAMIWGIQYRYTADALLLVLASRAYEPEDYIRDYDEFLGLCQARRQPPGGDARKGGSRVHQEHVLALD
ncbi:MAG TPA: WxcM-like domain-containing protein [Solirubrobacteraceae bacterium]|nr:WxcM-like domain-containing protein [Solirubrobacteraceae bacterium]